MTPRWALVVAVGLAVPHAPENQALPGIRARMEQALAFLAGGEAERAIPLLLSIVDEAPEHGPARLQLGALAVERREWEVAADHLRAAMAATGPDAPKGAVPVQRPGLGWALLAEALDQAGDLEEALSVTGSALRFSPDYLPALLHRSNLARRLPARGPGRTARLETALETARRARRLAPSQPGPWTALALAAQEASASDLAVCAAQRAAELAPDDPRASFRLARIAAETDPEMALAAAEAALAGGLDSEAAVWMALGGLRAFPMEMDASLAAYAEALRLDPSVAGQMASLALDALAAGGDPELLALLRDRAARRPNALNTRFALAKADLRAGRTDAALAELKRLETEWPAHPAILTALHAGLRRTGDPAADAVLARLETVKAADEAAWKRADAAEEERREARAAASRGDFEEAARRWEALAGDAGTASDWAELGSARTALGRHREALEAFRRSLEVRPFDLVILSAAVEAARLAGDPGASDRYAARARLAAADCGAAR